MSSNLFLTPPQSSGGLSKQSSPQALVDFLHNDCWYDEFANGGNGNRLESQPVRSESAATEYQSQRPRLNSSIISELQAGQKHKRKEQNKNAQRAYRERQTQHAAGLESKVKELADQVRLLQTDNGDLLKRLCGLQTQNNELRMMIKSLEGSPASHADLPSFALSTLLDSTALSHADVESLHEPHLAMWNLLASYLPPKSPPESFVAVFNHLQAMAIQTIRDADEVKMTGDD